MGKHQVTTPTHNRPPATGHRKAVFLDRDGVINPVLLRDGKPYPPTSLAEFTLLPGVTEACQKLKNAGFLLIVATNQPDVGRGTLDPSVVEQIHDHLQSILPLDRIEVCYHPGNEKTVQPQPGQPEPEPKLNFEPENRKPAPGMLLRAARQLEIDLARSFMVGDRWRDIDCGKAAGCTTLFIDYGYSEALRAIPDHTVKNLSEAAQIILDPVSHNRVQ